jgi:RNA polymerase sigma factor (sigma-70 family)
MPVHPLDPSSQRSPSSAHAPRLRLLLGSGNIALHQPEVSSVVNTPLDPDSADILAVAEGDMGALARLWRRHHEAFLSFLRKRWGVGEDVDDLHQQFWLELPRAARRFDPRLGRGRAWMFGVLCKLRLSFIRRWTRRLKVEVSPPEPEAVEREPALRRLSPEDWLTLCRVFPTLSERDRETLLLAAEGFTDQEGGEIAGCAPEAFRQRLVAARRRLRAGMGEGLADA